MDTSALPPAISVVTLQPLPCAAAGASGCALLRLGHEFALAESPTLSKPVTVSLDQLFGGAVTAAQELSLSANQAKAFLNANRVQWRAEQAEDAADAACDRVFGVSGASMNVTLVPMEIKTFSISF